LVRDLVEGERRDEADHALRITLRRLGEAVVRIEIGVWELVEPARQANDLAIPLHAADRRCRDAGTRELRKAHDAVRSKEVSGHLALGSVPAHRYVLYHHGA
jgi:hypothetical protein